MPYFTKKSVQKMILTLPVVMSALPLTMAHAATSTDHAKLATITKMYQQDISNEGLGKPVLMQYGSSELKAALKLEQQYFDKNEMICGTGHDVLWESQDPNYEQDKQISVHSDGLVNVTLAQGETVRYKMACDATKCMVADVIMADNTSLKDFLNKSCR